MSNILDKAIHAGSDLLDKASSPASRVGLVVDRVVKMAANGVCVEAITAQLNSNSANKQTYTHEHVAGFINLHKDCVTKVPVSKESAQSLIDCAKEASLDGSPVTP